MKINRIINDLEMSENWYRGIENQFTDIPFSNISITGKGIN